MTPLELLKKLMSDINRRAEGVDLSRHSPLHSSPGSSTYDSLTPFPTSSSDAGTEGGHTPPSGGEGPAVSNPSPTPFDYIKVLVLEMVDEMVDNAEISLLIETGIDSLYSPLLTLSTPLY